MARGHSTEAQRVVHVDSEGTSNTRERHLGVLALGLDGEGAVQRAHAQWTEGYSERTCSSGLKKAVGRYDAVALWHRGDAPLHRHTTDVLHEDGLAVDMLDCAHAKIEHSGAQREARIGAAAVAEDLVCTGTGDDLDAALDL